MSKALCTLAVGSHLELLQYALPTFEEFADLHGYELVVQRDTVGDFPPSWEKVRLLRQLLDDHEQVLWIDADAMIADTSKDIFDDIAPDRSFVEPDDGIADRTANESNGSGDDWQQA
jgi:hypothetical protein